jgi:riboflavin synthase
MFTGLIETVGEVADVSAGAASARISIRTTLATELQIGQSLAVNGVCLTVVSAAGGAVAADIGPETARVTTLGELRPGTLVNLERSVPAEGRFDGHFVQGHADGIGEVMQMHEDGEAHWLTVSFPSPLAPYLIHRGSIAVDGVSLTIATLRDAAFDVMLIPHTWAATAFPTVQPGGRVNLECDMIGKYVARTLELRYSIR